MASLLRVYRGFARQLAAPPPVGRLGSGGAALSEVSRSRRRLSFFLYGGRAAMSSHTDAPSLPASDVSGTTHHKDKAIVRDFVAVDKDLESDEALWALYERWCKHFDEERDHDEMLRRFPEFKETALLVDRVNKANLPYKLGFNQFADGKLWELCSNSCPMGDLGLDDYGIALDDYGIARRRWLLPSPESAGDESKDGHHP